MNMMKKWTAAVLAVLMLLSLAGCHRANEVAVDYGDVSFTSGLYSLALLNADSEAKSKVDETLSEDETAETVDYYTKEIDGKPYIEWVENRALEQLDTQAAYRLLCKQNGVTVKDDMVKSVENYAKQYYSYYESILAANGIGENSYRELMMGNAYSDAYFRYLYDEGGVKAISEDELKTSFDTSYRFVVLFKKDLSSLTEETKIAEAKAAVDTAKSQLESGMDPLTVFNSFNGATQDNAAKELKNVVSVVADSSVSPDYGISYFDQLKNVPVGKTYLHDEAGKEYTLALVIDAHADASYYEDLKDTLRWDLKSEEFNKEVEAFADSLTRKVNKRAIKPFTVKGIKQGEAA